jgi:hypothetical protein
MQAQAREAAGVAASATPAVNLWRLIAACILALGLSQDGRADDTGLPFGWRGTLHGIAQINYSARPGLAASRENDGLGEHGFLLADQRMQLKLEARSSKGAVSLLAKPEFFYDAVDEEFGADLREGYLDFARDRWDVRLGRQIITWGIGDLVFINDVFPKDYAAYRRSVPAGFPVRPELRDLIGLRLTKFLRYQTLKLSLFTFYSPLARDYFLNPEISYNFTDHLWAALGGNIFGGPSSAFFGQLGRNDNIHLTLRYSF